MLETRSPHQDTDPSTASSRWVASLNGEHGERLRRTLATLPLRVLAEYPPPRRGGLPFGRESSVLTRLVRRQSVQLYPSGLSRALLAFAPAEHKRLVRAFTLGDAMSRDEWASVLGRDEIPFWERAGFLLTATEGLRAAFRVVVLGKLRLVVDAFAHQEQFKNRVHVGKDTVVLLESLPRGSVSRHLDVGTGSGALLLANACSSTEAVGVDINPRAVAVARFNTRLNDCRCNVLEGDVFELSSLGRFDLVTWNLPFHFFPEEERANNLDGDGGNMGIELTLRFIQQLPSLLTESGCARLLTSSPTLVDGTELLLQSLSERAPALRLDISVTFLQALWASSRRRFHRAHGIRRIDNVLLEVRPGTGRFERRAAEPMQRAIDWLQEVRYSSPVA